MGKVYVAPGAFCDYLEGLKEVHGSYRAVASEYEINSAYITWAFKGRIYKRLLDALNVTLNEPNPYIKIYCPPELRDKFDNQRGEKSRREWLEELMLLADGVGELNY